MRLLLTVQGYLKEKANQFVRPLSKLVVLVKAPSKNSSQILGESVAF